MEILGMIECIFVSLVTRIKRYIYFIKFDSVKKKFSREAEELYPDFKEWVTKTSLERGTIVKVDIKLPEVENGRMKWPKDLEEKIMSDPRWGLGIDWDTYIELLLKNHLELYVIEDGRMVCKSKEIRTADMGSGYYPHNKPTLYAHFVEVKEDRIIYIKRNNCKDVLEELLSNINDCWPNWDIKKGKDDGIEKDDKGTKKERRKKKFDNEIKDIEKYFKE